MPRLGELLQGEWGETLAREGMSGAVDLSGDACPACGCTAPLLDGACSDCGLQLEG